MDIFRIEFSSLNDLLDLNDDALSCRGHIGVEVSLCLFELQIAQSISSFGLDQGKITENGPLLNILLALENSSWTRLGANLHIGLDSSLLDIL